MTDIDKSSLQTATKTELIEIILFLYAKIERLSVSYTELQQENTVLKQEIAELRSRLNQNSQNSSRPPSGDGYRKIIKNSKKESVKPQGGQIGHKGNTLHRIENPDEIVKCCPSQCNCGYEFSEKDSMIFQTRRQVFDIPLPKLFVTEYQLFDCKCPCCGQVNKGESPTTIRSSVQYGNMAKSLVVMLNNEFKMPFEKISQLFSILFGYEINESTVVTAINNCCAKLVKTEEMIKQKITQSAVGHVDETGIRIGKVLNWLHVFSTESETYLFAHPKRGKEAMLSKQSILPDFQNWLVHDCLGSYFHFDQAKHALCNAHILRELQGIMDNAENETGIWAQKMKNYLIKVHEMDFLQRIKNQIPLNKEYYTICREGLAAEPLPQKIKTKKGRPKNTKARNLLHRLIKHQESILAFAYHEDVPFTNNLAERDLRPAKIKLKISNNFRSEQGANSYTRIQGFISTVRKNGKNILTEIYDTFNGYNFITADIL